MNKDRKLEALFDAIVEFNGSRRPDDAAYQAKNPLRLQVFTAEGRATGKLRHFDSLHGGILAALFDLRCKCSGKSRAKLDGDNFTLNGLMRAYNLPITMAGYVAKFLRKALGDDSIAPTTSLSYFVEESSETVT